MEGGGGRGRFKCPHDHYAFSSRLCGKINSCLAVERRKTNGIYAGVQGGSLEYVALAIVYRGLSYPWAVETTANRTSRESNPRGTSAPAGVKLAMVFVTILRLRKSTLYGSF